jgi:hypothetical protein
MGITSMIFGCRPWLALTLLAALVSAAVAPAQQAGRSRRPYVTITPDGDFEKALQENLQRLKGLENLRGILDRLRAHQKLLENSGLLDAKMLERLRAMGGDFDVNDPKNKELLGNLLDKAKKNPGLFEKMKKQIPELGKGLPDLTDKKQLDELKKLVETDEKKVDEGGPADTQREDGGGGPGKKPPDDRPPLTPQGQETEPEHDFTDTVRNWLDRMKDWKGVGDLVKDSPTIQDAIEDFTLSVMEGREGPRFNADWLEGAGEMADYAGKGLDAFDSTLTNLGNLKFNALPRFNLPSFGHMPSFSLPNVGGGPSMGGGGGSMAFLTFVVWVVMIVAFAIILWQLWSRYANSPGIERARAAWRLGAWPVDPARVASRRELIAAFEYLSLLLLGPAAQTWNHRDIAVNLAEQKPAGPPVRENIADRLAGLYELARYAPEEGPLPPEALAEARRDLCYLAGVSAA